MANKIYKDAKSALDGLLHDDLMLMCGGFGLVGVPDRLIAAVRSWSCTCSSSARRRSANLAFSLLVLFLAIGLPCRWSRPLRP